MVNGLQSFIYRPQKLSISIFSEAPRGCDIGMSMELLRIFAWGAPLDGGLELKCGEREIVDKQLSITCHCPEPRKQGSP